MELAEILLASNGLASAKVGDRWLHSRIDPKKEAEKIVSALPDLSKKVAVLVINSGLGYLCTALRQHYPTIQVISLYTNNTLPSSALDYPLSFNMADHNPAEMALQGFLDQTLNSISPDLIHVLPWQPGCVIDQDLFTIMLTQIRFWLEKQHSDQATAKYFYLPWLRNCLRNLLFLQFARSNTHDSLTTVIAASGPSLIHSLADIKKHRSNIRLIALPSSLSCLKLHNIQWDIAIQTDGGYWAKHHHVHNFTASPWVAALRSAIPYDIGQNHTTIPIALSTIEAILWQIASVEAIPSWLDSPTVASQAIYAARYFSSGPIVLVGADMAVRGLQSHVHPHTFDYQNEIDHERIAPRHSTSILRFFDSQATAISSTSPYFINPPTQLFRQALRQAHDLDKKLYQIAEPQLGLFPSPPANCFETRRSGNPAIGIQKLSWNTLSFKERRSILLVGLADLPNTISPLMLQSLLAEIPTGIFPKANSPATLSALINYCQNFLLRWSCE